ncbi:conserved protein of unknown function [Shewanella benthica]|uniref:Uncharacterized protein n=1 Tax=Shewanella benthica TaxID=43661 RepID=A0A330M6J5_9GAMM|nr:hypothetical protein [Shewanella benthica]SQH77758.1 conserved protein of unknown function [Shewanella benthica]
MKDEQHNKPATEPAEEFDSELQTWYKLQAQEQASSELDDAIIKMAIEASAVSNQAAVDSSQHQAPLAGDKNTDNVVRVENSFWRKNRWVLSSAASVMLVVTVVMLNPQSPQEILSDDAMPMMMQMSQPLDEQLESLQADAVDVKSESRQAHRTQSAMPASAQQFDGAAAPKMKHTGEGADDRAKLGAAASSNLSLSSKSLSSHALPNKSVPQREAMVSAKQALNHLQNLIDSKLWDEAEKLANKLAKQYPNLEESEHPQHQRWSELQAEITAH